MYEPFLISSFQTGKHIGVKPWMTPPDAWPTLLNMRVKGGVLKKRSGKTLVGSTGASLPIMGIFRSSYEGVDFIIAADTKRLYRVDPVADAVIDLSGANTFTGTDHHYFHHANWLGKTYLTNFENPIYKYTPSSDAIAAVTVGATIDTCKFLMVYKNRLLVIGPVISSAFYPMRLMYSDVLSETIDSLSYVTADGPGGDDVPMAVAYLGLEPIVFCRNSIWRISYTGNTDTPFTWDRIPDADCGSISSFCVGHRKDLYFLSNRGLVKFDGYSAIPTDLPAMRDWVDLANFPSWHYCQATKSQTDNLLYLSYATDSTKYPNRILEFNLDEGTFSESSHAVHCLYGWDGYYQPAIGSIGEVYLGDNDITGDVDINISPNTFPLRSNPVTLAGDLTGNIFALDSGTSDNGSNISIDAKGAMLNPYAEKGLKCRLQKIEFYVTKDVTASFLVSVYKNQITTAFKTQTITCTGDGDYAWQVMQCNGEVGEFFRIGLSHTAKANTPEIHAVRLLFAPAGPSDKR